jgi:Icc-related predicted phosphoesterase
VAEQTSSNLRIAYVVDVHDRFDSVPRAAEAVGDPDVLVVGGDVTTGGTPNEAAAAIEQWRPLAPRLLAVAGNMDSPAIDARLVELAVSLDGRGVAIDGVGLFGVSAAPHSPLHTPHELSENELARKIETGWTEIASCQWTIFCPHAPPYGTACDRLRDGTHVGSTAVREFIEKAQPDVVLCGHIHESRGVDQIGAARVANPGPVAAGHYAVVEVGEAVTISLD